MAIFPFDDILTTFKNGTSRALRVVTENLITGGYSPANLTMQNAVTANGNGTTLNVNEYATAVLEIRGTFSATINFECSIDGTNWYPVLATKNDGIISSSCSTAGLYEIKVAAWKSIRARVSGYVSGNVTVVGKVSPLVNAEKSMQLTGSLPSGNEHVGQVGYTLKKVATNFTRPSDTTPYTVGDAITNSTSAPVVFQLDLGALGAVAGQAVEVRKIAVISSAKQAILPLMNIYLSNVTFTATNDNSALDIADEVMQAGGAWFNTDIQNYTASNSRVSQQNISIPMTLADADTKLYGILQDTIGYTPASGEVFTIVAWIALL